MKQAIRAEQIRLLFSSFKWSVLATIINSIVLTVVMMPAVEDRTILLWLACMLFITVCRIILTYAYFKFSPGQLSITRWEWLFTSGVILAAMMWGSTALIIFPDESISHQVFLAFVVGGMAAGSITTLAYHLPSIMLFLFISLTPLIVRFFQVDSAMSVAMEVMLLVYLVMLIISAVHSYINRMTNIRLYRESMDRELVLARSEIRFRTLLESINDAYLVFDPSGKIYDCNEQACKSLHYTREDIDKISYFDIAQGIDYISLKQMWPLLKQGKRFQLELIHRRKDDSTFPVEVHISHICIDEQELVYVLAHDITELKSTLKKSIENSVL